MTQSPSDQPGIVEVTQEDREAAADALWRDNQHRSSCKARDGEIDQNWLIQAFARHRIAALQSSRPVAGEEETARGLLRDEMRASGLHETLAIIDELGTSEIEDAALRAIIAALRLRDGEGS
jgi:hypothetical protein